ncbi:hypothetical protein R1sor_006264 [Riccia sorocarpa]|uniref:Uncharacterized protein n=1 Tax=Riccia sorocarpa TaxID=122646 RepID=A0ABD3HLW5_9MARC
MSIRDYQYPSRRDGLVALRGGVHVCQGISTTIDDPTGASSRRRIEVLVIEVLVHMASSDPIDKEARQRTVGGDEAAKFRVRLRDDIELQLESATAMLFNAESHIVKALYDGNKESANREIYDAHGKS